MSKKTLLKSMLQDILFLKEQNEIQNKKLSILEFSFKKEMERSSESLLYVYKELRTDIEKIKK